MYYDIEAIKSDPRISDEYPYGNPFDHIIDIMKHGAIIVRFKYVSNNRSLPPEEKAVSYHIMNFIKFLGHNPFGVSGIDLKSVWIGKTNSKWHVTTIDYIKKKVWRTSLTHIMH